MQFGIDLHNTMLIKEQMFNEVARVLGSVDSLVAIA